MKAVRKSVFSALLVLTCCAVYCWQHALASLPYLPNNCIVPLGILTPGILALTFLTTLALLRQTETPKPVRRSLLSMGAMLVPMIMTAVFFLSFLTYRYAAALPPLLVLPDWPVGIVTMIICFFCVAHLTALLICGFVMRKTTAKKAIAASVGWVVLNACMFLIMI